MGALGQGLVNLCVDTLLEGGQPFHRTLLRSLENTDIIGMKQQQK